MFIFEGLAGLFMNETLLFYVAAPLLLGSEFLLFGELDIL